MLKKPLFCLIFTFLSISSSLMAQDAPDRTAAEPGLAAALCEMEYWECAERAGQDSLLLAKAEYLRLAGECGKAYETLCRIPNYGLSPEGRADLVRRKLICSYSAGMIDEFRGLLDEAEDYGLLDGVVFSNKTSLAGLRNENVAMILSVIPGAGLAYAGDWKNAGKYFLLNGSIIALGVGAFTEGLYVSAFLGGGMLLYTTLPRSTEMAIQAASAHNKKVMLQSYTPIYEALLY